jgi:hypothetical protein
VHGRFEVYGSRRPQVPCFKGWLVVSVGTLTSVERVAGMDIHWTVSWCIYAVLDGVWQRYGVVEF